MGTRNTGERAAAFVAFTLLTGLVGGVWAFFGMAGTESVPLVVASVLIALFLIVLTVYVTVKLHKADRALEKYGVPPGRPLRLLTRRQWLTMTIGLAVIAIGTGSMAGVEVITHPAASAGALATPTPTQPIPQPVGQPTPTPTPTPAPSPSDSSATASPGDSSASDGTSDSANPAPGATTYLDSQPPLEGGYNSGPVTFSGTRYLRGIYRQCAEMTYSYVQWNVAKSSRFSAVAGISDDTPNAYGIAVDMVFYDQDGHQLTAKPVEVSVGHPVQVTINLTGVVSLRMACSARFVTTNRSTYVVAALGDPVVVAQ